VEILNAVLLHPHELSPISVKDSRWAPERPTNKVPLHLASKVLSSVEGIKTMLEPYGAALVNGYALKATVQQQVAATRKRRHKKNALLGATVGNVQWHSGCSKVREHPPWAEKWLARSDPDLEMAIASLAMIPFTVQDSDEQSLNKGAQAIRQWANTCDGGILAAVRSHKGCGAECTDKCHLWAVCKKKQCKKCKTAGDKHCDLCGGVIGSMKGKNDCVGLYEALQLFEHF
jgi:hypothetical protein